jgi:uncharacterized protein
MKLPAALLLVLPALAAAQGLDYVKAHYTKHEHYIPMRDGVRLFTAVYEPKDTSQRFPMLMMRTPYSVGPYGADEYKSSVGPSEILAREGYIFVYQDVRGRWMSEGEFDNMRPHRAAKSGPKDIDESTDTYDTIEWLTKHVPNHNGRVGQYGISYPGFYAAAGMIDAHPALKAVSPQAPIADWFAGDDWHHNGALQLPHVFNFMVNFGRPRPAPLSEDNRPGFSHGTGDGYDFFLRMGPLRNSLGYMKDVAFWHDVMRHETYDDFWQARNLRPHLKNIKPAVMVVGGWFDAENLYGALEVYNAVERNSPGSSNILVMGPWVHGGWSRGAGDSLGAARFDSKTSEYFREKIEAPFFNHYLKDKGEYSHPEAYVFETGVNQWRMLDSWPPKQQKARTLYFHPHGKLSFDAPRETGEVFDEYVSDPARPVPFYNEIVVSMDYAYMTADQRFASRRPDVLVYQTEPLEEDVTLAGPVTPKLFVSTSGTDSDWIVKVIDVYPNRYPDARGNPDSKLGGYQQLLRGDVMRGKFRNSLSKPEAFTPNRATRLDYAMKDVYHTFRRGHRIMVQVESTWFPLINLNPGKFMNINEASASDFQKTTQRVYRSVPMPSGVEVGVLR